MANLGNISDIIENVQLPNEKQFPFLAKTFVFISARISEFGLRCQTVNDTIKCAECMEKLADTIKIVEETGEEMSGLYKTIQDLIDKIPFDKWKEICSNIFAPILKNGQKEVTASLKEAISDKIAEAKTDMASEVITNGAICASLLIALQIVKLVDAWNTVSNAGNVVEESREIFPEIKKNIGELADGIEKVSEKMELFEETEAKEEKIKIASQVTHMTSGVKIEISKQVERVNLTCDEQVMEGITNVIQGISNAFQYIRLGNMLSANVRILQGVITGAYFGLAACNATIYTISKSTLKELRATMKVVGVFERELKKYHVQVHNAEEICLKFC